MSQHIRGSRKKGLYGYDPCPCPHPPRLAGQEHREHERQGPRIGVVQEAEEEHDGVTRQPHRPHHRLAGGHPWLRSRVHQGDQVCY
jgi:hypothetical protein